MKCRATSRAALPCTTEEMSCQGILGVVYLSMKSGGQESTFGPLQTKEATKENCSILILTQSLLWHGTKGNAGWLPPQIHGPCMTGELAQDHSEGVCCFFLTAKPKQFQSFQGAKTLTSKRFVKLNPVFEDKVAIVFPMPEPGFPKQLSHTCLQAANGSFICHSKEN